MRRAALSLSIAIALSLPGAALPGESAEVEIRQTFEKFVAAQNAHDARAVRDLLWDGPGFLWITRGNVIWGRDEAIKRFETNYGGTWKLDADISLLRVTLLDAATAQILIPLVVTSGPAGQAPQSVSIHMNQTLVRSPSGWKVASILPIPVPKP
jgi:ketosteroid isomerase-like protein